MKQIRKRVFSNSGKKISIRYIRKLDDNGFPIMVENEKFNLYSDIQSYAEDNNIERIIERLGGDISKLDLNKGVYIDCTKIPDNYNDLMNQVSEIANDYSRLPLKYKEKLKNNYNLYYGLAMSGKVKDFINYVDSGEDNVKVLNELLSKKNYDFNNLNNSESKQSGEEVNNV